MAEELHDESNPPFGKPVLAMTTAEIQFELEAAEPGHQDAMRSAISEYLSTRTWPQMPRDTQFFLSQRLQTVADHLSGFCSSGLHPESSWIPFPTDIHPADLALYYLLDWSSKHASRLTAYRLIAQANDKQIDPSTARAAASTALTASIIFET